MINKEKFEIMKKGVRLLNFARGGLVVNKDLLEAIENGTVACYVTDFPEDELLGNDILYFAPSRRFNTGIRGKLRRNGGKPAS